MWLDINGMYMMRIRWLEFMIKSMVWDRVDDDDDVWFWYICMWYLNIDLYIIMNYLWIREFVGIVMNVK